MGWTVNIANGTCGQGLTLYLRSGSGREISICKGPEVGEGGFCKESAQAGKGQILQAKGTSRPLQDLPRG